MWLTGEPVTVEVVDDFTRNAYGEKVPETHEVVVDNVLVAPAGTEDLGEDRPEGFEARYTLCFPKTCQMTFAKQRIKVRGNWYHTAGYTDKFVPCPTEWDKKVVVGDVHG